jgi:hypothetical protein
MSIPRNLGAFADNVTSSGTLNVTGINATGTPSSTTALLGNGSWGTVGGGNGGSTVTNPMSANITLTSTSNRVQVMTPSAFGYSITLPDATTITSAGGPIFILKNLLRSYAAFPIKVLDSAGTNIGWVVPDYDTEVYLTSTAAATGNWVIETHNPTANGGIYPYGNGYSSTTSNTMDSWAQNVGVSSNVAFSSNAFGTGDRYWLGVNANYTQTYPINQISQSQSPGNAYVQGTSTFIRLSDTKIMYIWNGTGNTLYAQVKTLNADGSTASTGSQLTVASNFTGIYGLMQAIAISATSVLLCYGTNAGPQTISSKILTISGNTITAGTQLLFASSSSPASAAFVSLLSPTLATVLDGYGTGNVYSLTISGSTVTLGGSATAIAYPNGYGIFTASSTTSVVVYMSSNGSDVYARVVTNNGATFSLGTEVLLFSTGSGAGQYGAVSQLAVGLGLLVPYVGYQASCPQAYYVLAVSGGVPYIKSQGTLPANINQAQYFYPINGTCLVQTNTSGAGNGYGATFQKCVITGAS